MKRISHKSIRVFVFLAALIGIYVFPVTAQADKPIIYHLDLRYTESLAATKSWDIRLASVCVQGLVNREAPRLFVSFTSKDTAWLDRMTESGGLCEGWQVREITFTQMLTIFRGYINGLILFDPDYTTGAISSSLVAATTAGIEGGIAVRKDTTGYVYRYMVYTLGVPVLKDLAGKFTGSGTIYDSTTASTGSAKCDAYIWAKEHYIDTGECDPTVLSYSLDMYGISMGTNQANQIENLDYPIMKKGFCFELSPWGDEAPSDDKTQPVGTDLSTFRAILNACNVKTNYSKMIRLCGFPHWDLKYTSYAGGSHGASSTESEFIQVLSPYNVYCEPAAPNPCWFANASFYAALMPEVKERHYVQNPSPTYNDLVSRGYINSSGSVVPGNYIMMGLGDYDGPGWIFYEIGNSREINDSYYGDPIWSNSLRGQVYCNWGINPNLIERGSAAIDYYYRHKSAKDFFVAWNSGAGYVDPADLHGTRDSGYGDARPMWQEHCRQYYRLLNYSITGWTYPPVYSDDLLMFAFFSNNGVAAVGGQKLLSNMPCCNHGIDLANSYSPSLIINKSSGVNFASYDTTCWTPRMVRDTETYWSGKNNHQFMDAPSYFYLLRYYLGGDNDYRATWVDDTIPRFMNAGGTYTFNVTVRNDGWDTWSEANNYRLGCAIVSSGNTPSSTNYDANGRFHLPSGATVAPGGSVTFTVTVTAPSTTGNYDLYLDMVRDGTLWFHDQYNLERVKPVSVVSNTATVDTDGDGTPDETENANGTFFWYPGDNYELSTVTPSAPSDAGTYQKSTTVKFTWPAVADAVGYYCQIGTAPDGNDVFDGYLDNVLYKSIAGTDGSTYYCRIQAINNTGYASRWSASSDGITIDSTAPTTPAAPTHSGIYSGTSVTYNWNAATDATSGVAGYYCRIGTTSGGTDVYNGYVGNVLTKTVTASAGTTLYCSVYAADNAGNSGAWSASSDGIKVVSQPSDDTASLKGLADGTSVGVSNEIVTGSYNGFFYIEDAKRVSGIKVVSGASVAVNQLADVAGTMATANSERYINATAVQTGATSSIAPFGVSGKSISDGLSMVGLLLKTWGNVTCVNSTDGYCYIDDGSRISDGSGCTGVRVVISSLSSTINENSFYKLTGVLGMSATGFVIYPQTSESMVP